MRSPPDQTPVPSIPPRSTELRTADALSERLAAELAERWRRGERPRAEEYLDRHPALWEQPEAATDLIYEEVCLRQEHGESDAAEDALRRFPQWRAELEVLFRFHDLVGPPPAAPTFPEVGETLGEFRLLGELGRGSRGRVYLAAQPSLADRRVVLKLTPCDGREHLSLSRLQHTNIVPIHSVQDDPSRNLRLLCMPFFGGVTLARLLDACAGGPAGRCTGRDLLAVLDADASGKAPVPPRGAMRHFLAGASFLDAVCCWGAHLADALQYAHEHGLVHLDVKPSNVLIAVDGQPMLLDFHLARGPVEADGALDEWVGGTLQYMSPEQRAAMDAVQTGRQVPLPVDARSDIYSLGLVLYQALGGTFPPPDGKLPRLERCNSRVSPGLADIIHKCLAPAPAGRYAAAGELAADLRRHLADMPLRGVANRSVGERWRKWRRRKPHAPRLLAMAGAVGLALVAFAVLAVAEFSHRTATCRELLAAGARLREAGHFNEAAGVFRRGRALAEGDPLLPAGLVKEFDEQIEHAIAGETAELLQQAVRHREAGAVADAVALLRRAGPLAERLPADGDLARAVRAETARTERLDAAEQLHGFADRIRFLYASPSSDHVPVEGLAREAATWWERHQALTEDAAFLLPAAVASRLADDLRDLGVVLADLETRRGAADRPAAARRALAILDDLEAQFGRSRVVQRERERHARSAGLPVPAADAAEPPEPHTPWEWYALGRSYLAADDLEHAAPALRRAVGLQPDALWPNFYDGVCAYRQGRYDDAVVAFTACHPRTAECCFNRALAYEKLQRPDRALADYARAIEQAPGWGAPALNRGILFMQAKDFRNAAGDFARALEKGADPAQVHYHFALLHQAGGSPAEALNSVERALQHDPRHEGAARLRERLRQSAR
jgi:serine/threonine protein kinase/tetratricopeptide (TPR) repeat protein